MLRILLSVAPFRSAGPAITAAGLLAILFLTVGISVWPTARRSPCIPKKPTKSWPTPAWAGRRFTAPAKQDRNLPSWIPSTVHYARWGWGELEPQPGKLEHGLPRQGAEGDATTPGQKLAFRVMACSTSLNQPVPPEMDHRSRRPGVDRPTTTATARSRSPTWTIPSSCNAISTSSSGWASGTTATRTSTTWTSAPSAGGASGT